MPDRHISPTMSTAAEPVHARAESGRVESSRIEPRIEWNRVKSYFSFRNFVYREIDFFDEVTLTSRLIIRSRSMVMRVFGRFSCVCEM